MASDSQFTAAVEQLPKSTNHCLVITPTYQESMNIERLIAEVLAQSPDFDILVVDDNSPDGTADLVEHMAQFTDRIHLIRRPGKMGLGTAYLDGFKWGLARGFGYLIQMDADFSHQPVYAGEMLNIAEHSTDVVLGSRNVPGGRVENWSKMRELISKGGSAYARIVLGMPIMDCTGGFKCFRASALRQIDLGSIRSNGYAFQVEMNYRCVQAGLRMCELPITFPDRVAGQSKMAMSIITEAALLVIKMRLASWMNPQARRAGNQTAPSLQ